MLSVVSAFRHRHRHIKKRVSPIFGNRCRPGSHESCMVTTKVRKGNCLGRGKSISRESGSQAGSWFLAALPLIGRVVLWGTGQLEASIKVTWSLSSNQKPGDQWGLPTGRASVTTRPRQQHGLHTSGEQTMTRRLIIFSFEKLWIEERSSSIFSVFLKNIFKLCNFCPDV